MNFIELPRTSREERYLNSVFNINEITIISKDKHDSRITHLRCGDSWVALEIDYDDLLILLKKEGAKIKIFKDKK